MRRPNEALLRRYFTAAADGDLTKLNRLLADDVGHITGNHALSGDYQGKQAVLGFGRSSCW